MKNATFVKALEKATKWRNLYNRSDAIPDKELPHNFDLRDVGGFDFTGKIRDQAECGSCYTQAFIQTVQSRLMYKYGKQVPELSVQQAMVCNFLNEGCSGGNPNFHGYFFEHAHMVSEKCAPYKPSTKNSQCSAFKKCGSVAKIAKTYFVGGGWGQVSEKDIMKELLRGGALTLNFEATKIIGFYSSGIMSEHSVSQLSEFVAQKLIEDKNK